MAYYILYAYYLDDILESEKFYIFLGVAVLSGIKYLLKNSESYPWVLWVAGILLLVIYMIYNWSAAIVPLIATIIFAVERGIGAYISSRKKKQDSEVAQDRVYLVARTVSQLTSGEITHKAAYEKILNDYSTQIFGKGIRAGFYVADGGEEGNPRYLSRVAEYIGYGHGMTERIPPKDHTQDEYTRHVGQAEEMLARLAKGHPYIRPDVRKDDGSKFARYTEDELANLPYRSFMSYPVKRTNSAITEDDGYSEGGLVSWDSSVPGFFAVGKTDMWGLHISQVLETLFNVPVVSQTKMKTPRPSNLEPEQLVQDIGKGKTLRDENTQD